MPTRHFLSLLDFSSDELRELITSAIDVKQRLKQGISHRPLEGKILAMIFEKPSLRTRVSFEQAMIELGGHSLMSMQVVSRFEKSNGYKLHPQDLVSKTIREIAATCQEQSPDSAKPGGMMGRISKMFGRQKSSGPEGA